MPNLIIITILLGLPLAYIVGIFIGYKLEQIEGRFKWPRK